MIFNHRTSKPAKERLGSFVGKAKMKSIKWKETYVEEDYGKIVFLITEDKQFRISKMPDQDCDLNDWCKVMFSPKDRPEYSKEDLEKQEQEFREKFNEYGAVIVFLEKWDEDFNKYEILDCCGGFVGWDNFDESHYFVKELKERAKEKVGLE